MILDMKGRRIMGWHSDKCECLQCEVRRLKKENIRLREEVENSFKGVEQEIDGFVKRLIKLEKKRKWRPW